MPDWSDILSSRSLLALLLIGGLVVGTTGVAAQDASGELKKTDGKVVVESAENQTIAGTTDLEAGTNVTVRVASSGDTQPPFLKTDTATVGEDGGFEATFDFSEQNASDTFEVTVDSDSSSGMVAEAEGVVRAPEEDTSSSMPGFSVVVAVFAIVAVGAVAVRRQQS
ncbi:BGTF surface domain-containing protein [Halogeometricum borinquense]|uniref:BGTF surface domain-containing protein n=1 Tax=Halogeometricum borinquense TaxID=60847 RepID=UPI001F5C28A3|nr:BGTF surface domain-containing protein [Halogeometricum borinquense]